MIAPVMSTARTQANSRGMLFVSWLVALALPFRVALLALPLGVATFLLLGALLRTLDLFAPQPVLVVVVTIGHDAPSRMAWAGQTSTLPQLLQKLDGLGRKTPARIALSAAWKR